MDFVLSLIKEWYKPSFNELAYWSILAAWILGVFLLLIYVVERYSEYFGKFFRLLWLAIKWAARIGAVLIVLVKLMEVNEHAEVIKEHHLQQGFDYMQYALRLGPYKGAKQKQQQQQQQQRRKKSAEATPASAPTEEEEEKGWLW